MHSIRHALAARLRGAITPLCFAPAAAIMLTPLYAPVFASQQDASLILEPKEIDRAVAAFTGFNIGAEGGARSAADPRLRLAACARPLATSWHGNARAAVKVECGATLGDAGPWRIFVAVRSVSVAAASPTRARSLPAAPIVKRGDPITVVVRGRGFTVQQSGEAMNNGAIGDWIGVRTARQADPVRARIERPGLAVIPVS